MCFDPPSSGMEVWALGQIEKKLLIRRLYFESHYPENYTWNHVRYPTYRYEGIVSSWSTPHISGRKMDMDMEEICLVWTIPFAEACHLNKFDGVHRIFRRETWIWKKTVHSQCIRFESYFLRYHAIWTSSIAHGVSLMGERETEKWEGISGQGHVGSFKLVQFKPFPFPDSFVWTSSSRFKLNAVSQISNGVFYCFLHFHTV